MITIDDKNVNKTAVKLHRQFGHPTADKLVDLIEKSGCRDDNVRKAIEKVSSECETCLKFSKAAPRPVVSLPMASKFNETVSMDLKFYDGKIFLVLVDLATRYCAASLLGNKLPMTVIRAIFVRWISIFGPPKKFFSDNGGEFNNDEFKDMGEKFNIRVMGTSAESPFSNGVCERLNAVLENSVRKIVDDVGCDVGTALAERTEALPICCSRHARFKKKHGSSSATCVWLS